MQCLLRQAACLMVLWHACHCCFANAAIWLQANLCEQNDVPTPVIEPRLSMPQRFPFSRAASDTDSRRAH